MGSRPPFLSSRWLLLAGAVAAAILALILVSGSRSQADRAPAAAVDLAIGDTPGLGQQGIDAASRPAVRPGILVAWRNTERVLEIETLVQNHGRAAATGRVSVDILDAQHRVLATQPASDRPFVTSVPALAAGGDVGLTIQVPGTRRLNAILDRTDRARDTYCLRVSVDALGVADANLGNNVAVKCYNNALRLGDNGAVAQQFALRNTSSRSFSGKLELRQSALPDGWTVQSRPAEGETIALAPGAGTTGSITVQAPASVREGDYLDLRPSLVGGAGRVLDQGEIYVAADARRPAITSAFAAPARDPRYTYLSVRAVDPISGVAEASGASVEWSTDGGRTTSTRTLSYTDGNFLSPTGFDTDLGPFPRGTKLQLRLVVHDVLGNRAETAPVDLRMPLGGRVDLAR